MRGGWTVREREEDVTGKDNEGRRENASVTVIGKQNLHYQPKPANLNSIFNITLFHLHGNEIGKWTKKEV